MRRKKDNNEYSGIRAVFESSQVPDKLMPDSIRDMLDSRGYKKPKRNISRIVTSCTAVAAAAAVTIGIVRFAGHDEFSKSSIMQYTAENISTMHFAESYDEVYKYFDDAKAARVEYEIYEGAVESAADGGDMTTGHTLVDEKISYDEEGNIDIPNYQNENENGAENASALGDSTALVGSEDNVSPDPEYSDTYNQEKDILEADIVKTDGKTIYYSGDCQLNAVDVKDGRLSNPRSISCDQNSNKSLGDVFDLYLYKDKLIVIADYYNAFLSKDSFETGVIICDKNTLEIKDRYIQEGYYNDVRLREDGELYLVTCDYTSPVPDYVVNEEKSQISCDDILLPNREKDSDYYNTQQVNIAVLDLNSDTPTAPTDMKTIIGNGGNVYCTHNNLYIAGYAGYSGDETAVTRFELAEGKVIPRAGTLVKGYINDQFSMSEYNGYFRIATTFYTDNIAGIYGAEQNNALYVMDIDLKQVGKITNFGLNEEIKSVNFSGDTAYVVTFRNTDPLFAINLSDPTKPVVTDELKVTGYSGYMQPWGDGKLLGFGEEGDENGRLEGLKLSMFDNSDPNNLKLLDSAVIDTKCIKNTKIIYGDAYGWYLNSTALYERKALLIMPDKNLIGVPYNLESVCNYEDGVGIESNKSDYCSIVGYKFYSFNNGKFTEEGDVNEKTDVGIGYEYTRCVLIGDYVYMISGNKVLSVITTSFAKIDEQTFGDNADAKPENIGGSEYIDTFLDLGDEDDERYVDEDGRLFVNGKYSGIVD